MFNGISTFSGLFNAIFLEEQSWYYSTHSWKGNGVHTFLKGICPKVNVIARLEFDLAYLEAIKGFIQFIQTVLVQLIPFSISIDFVYTQLNVKTVLYETIQFRVSRVSMSKTVPFQTIQFSIST